MSRKLFVGGLSWNTTTEGLDSAFSVHGELLGAKVVTDRDTGRSRGFGFVEYANEESAKAAMEALNGKELDGRTIRLEISEERGGPPRPGGSGGRDRGPENRDRHPEGRDRGPERPGRNQEGRWGRAPRGPVYRDEAGDVDGNRYVPPPSSDSFDDYGNSRHHHSPGQGTDAYEHDLGYPDQNLVNNSDQQRGRRWSGDGGGRQKKGGGGKRDRHRDDYSNNDGGDQY